MGFATAVDAAGDGVVELEADGSAGNSDGGDKFFVDDLGGGMSVRWLS